VVSGGNSVRGFKTFICGAMGLALVTGLAYGQATVPPEESAYYYARYANTCSAYESALRQYPHSSQAQDALSNMVTLQCSGVDALATELALWPAAAPAADAAAPAATDTTSPAYEAAVAAEATRNPYTEPDHSFDYVLIGAFFVGLFLVMFFSRSFRRKKHSNQDEDPPHATPRPSATALPSVSTGQSATPDVFLSYKRDERAQIIAIAQRLQSLEVNVWFDADMRSGTTFDAEIEKQVRAAKCVLVCWSPGAVASDWVRAEATIGRQRGVLAAAVLKDCDLPPPFNLLHAEDLRSGIGPQNPEWLKVLERIGALIGRPGLAGYEAAGQDRAALAAWMAENPRDPLFERAVAILKGSS
jgi:hypothetical protein